MKKKSQMKIVYIVTIMTGVVMLIIQLIISNINNRREAESTTKAYVLQTEKILENNEREEAALLASLKEDYIVLSKAVAYYLDKYPDAVNDVTELNKVAELMSIDEIHIFDETGTIIASTNPAYLGYNFDSGEQISYFKPMLSDKSLSMCQDVTPNTAEGHPMMYAITWNEAGTQMVQIGIEPVRLLEEIKKNEIQEVINDITLDENMKVIIADVNTLKIVGSSNSSYLSNSLTEVTSIKSDSAKTGFLKRIRLDGDSNLYYCNIDVTNDYCICIFQNSLAYVGRTIESVIIVTIYLTLALLAIVLISRRLFKSKEAIFEHLQIFESMSAIYYSLHLVDLEKNTAIEYSSKNQVKDAFNKNVNRDATQLMIGIMHATMSDEYLQRGLEFTDISTLSERLKGKKIISMELLGKNVGWIRMSFITLEEVKGTPTKAIIATQIIDEEKKNAEMLYNKSYIDELTGCFNRRAYNTDILEYENNPNENEFVYISFDINGLKTVNDNLGHEAGDELICGATECMKNVFSKYGKVYRYGGDEFIGLIHADAGLMEMLKDDFDNHVKNWHGKLIDSISVSYGYVLSTEAEGKTMLEIACLADKRMYESKEKYYKEKGIERRRT